MNMSLRAILLVVCAAMAMVMAFTSVPLAQAETPLIEKQTVQTLMIVHAPELAEAAREWTTYRQSEQGGGWRVITHQITAVPEVQAQRVAIQQAIRAAYAERGTGDFAVLLLGDAEPSGTPHKPRFVMPTINPVDAPAPPAQDAAPPAAPKPVPSPVAITTIPAWYFPQNDTVMRSWDGSNDEYATDHPYQLMDDADDMPDIALGRVPARNVEEARRVLAKIKRYEAPPTLEQLQRGDRARLTYTAGEGRFGVMDGVLEELFKMMIDRMVPDAFDFSVLYAKASSIYCPPPSQLTAMVLDQLRGGSLLYNYVGHGHDTGFDSLHWNGTTYRILEARDLQQLEKSEAARETSPSALLPIIFTSCCSTGFYDLPNGVRSLAEELLFNDAAGGIAIIAGSRITHPYANTAMQMHITQALVVERAVTVGSMYLRTMQGLTKRGPLDRQLDAIAQPIARSGHWETSLAEHRRMHVHLYNLFGDPATRIAHPALTVRKLTLNDGVISGEVAGMIKGRVTISLQTARTSMVHPDKVQTPSGDDDADLERKAAANVALVNDRTLARVEGDVIDGTFAIALSALDADWPANAAMIRAYAVGVNGEGQAVDALGALSLPRK